MSSETTETTEKMSILTDAMERAEKLKNRITGDANEETPTEKKSALKRFAIGAGIVAVAATVLVLNWKSTPVDGGEDETSSDDQNTED